MDHVAVVSRTHMNNVSWLVYNENIPEIIYKIVVY